MPLPNSYATPMPPGREPIDKAGAWHRLAAEGRLDEFNDRREEIRNELHTKGVKRKQAADDAWRLALAEFPSLPAEPEPATDDVEPADESASQENIEAELEELLADRSDIPTDLTGDILWSYEHLPHKSVSPRDAPNPGAWSLLRWARANPNRFFEHLLPKAANERAKKDPEEEQVAKARVSLDEREKLLEQMAREVELEMAEEDRVIDCPSCDVRILLKKPDLQKSWDGKAELDWPPPAVCPPDHPNY